MSLGDTIFFIICILIIFGLGCARSNAEVIKTENNNCTQLCITKGLGSGFLIKPDYHEAMCVCS
jgi:hypothetical protein